MIDDLPDSADLFSVAVYAAEANVIDSLLDQAPCMYEPLSDVSYDDLLPALVDTSSCPLEAINPIFNPLTFAAALDAPATISSFLVSIGATNAVGDFFCLEKDFDGTLLDNEVDISMLNPDLLDDIFTSSATSASHMKTAEHLSKIWKIDKDTTNRTIDVTTQRVRRSDDPSLARNFSTNDRMLRYRRLKEHFYMDTFFATKKAGVLSCGNSCMQLFVTDKGFIFVVGKKLKSEVPAAFKLFVKAICAPDAIICDHSGEQTSAQVCTFCNQIGSLLKVLEEGTPWANRAELYILV